MKQRIEVGREKEETRVERRDAMQWGRYRYIRPNSKDTQRERVEREGEKEKEKMQAKERKKKEELEIIH